MTDILNTMVILVDTREKSTHITDLFDECGVPWKRQTLKSGDYSAYIPKNDALGIKTDVHANVCIERKMNLNEVITNLTTHRNRFKREFARADQDIILMIENDSYADIVNHKYRNKIAPNSVLAALHSISTEFNVPFTFIDSTISPLFIHKTLYYNLRHILKNTTMI